MPPCLRSPSLPPGEPLYRARRLLLKLLSRRFGALPERVLLRIRSASEVELERWAERILTAPTLDAVLDDAG